jgi:CheY-like chemotaxis protein
VADARATPSEPTDRPNEVRLMPTALIVEDEPEANKLLAMLVQLRGYRTVSAYTGTEALEKVDDACPDIVFLDLMLPDINGYEVCKSLKSRKATGAIPVVMVTARVAAENRLECFGVGADDYIPKPYIPDQIFRAMADADAWRRKLQRHDLEAEIPIGTRDVEDSLRQLSQLRNLLLARTSLDPVASSLLGSALHEIWREAVAWGHAQGADLVATLAYRLHPDHLTVTVCDASGWLGAGPAAPGPHALHASAFDEVAVDAPGRRIVLRKWFAPVETTDRP